MRRVRALMLAGSFALVAGAAKADYTYTLPTSFFTSLQNATVTPASISFTSNDFSYALGTAYFSGTSSLTFAATLLVTGTSVNTFFGIDGSGLQVYGPGSYNLNTGIVTAQDTGGAFFGIDQPSLGVATFSNFVLTSTAPITNLTPVGAPLPALAGLPAVAALGSVAALAARRRRRIQAAA